MKTIHTLAKIALAVVALYMGIRIICSIDLIPLLCASLLSDNKETMEITAQLLYLAFTVALIYLFTLKGDFWANKIVGKIERTEKIDTEIPWIAATLQIVSISCGIVIIFLSLPYLSGTIQWAVMYRKKGVLISSPPPGFIIQLVVNTIRLALGIYLVFASNHFVRWQVKKTQALCKKLEVKN